MESQSRYSIVERLTKTKLEIMQEKNDLDLEVTNALQEINEKTQDLQQWKKDIAARTEREAVAHAREIELLKDRLETLKQRKAHNERSCDEKIAQLDRAMQSIENISRTAPNAEEQA